MGDGGGPASGNIISVGDDLVDFHLDVREGFFEEGVSLSEFGGAGEDGRGLGEAVSFAVGEKEFIDGGGVALIPNLVEPALDELLVGVAHGSSRRGKSSTGLCDGREQADAWLSGAPDGLAVPRSASL